MLLMSFMFAIIGIIIFAVSLVISYEFPDFPDVIQYIMWIIGFILLFIGAYLGSKSTKK